MGSPPFLPFSAVSAVGEAVIALFPVYAADLGASASTAGLVMAIVFAAITIGYLLGGRVMDLDRRPKRWLLFALAMASSLFAAMARRLAGIALCTAMIWISGGMALTMVYTLVGRTSTQENRGRAYGLLGTTVAIGAILGAGAGPIVDRWGWPAMFVASAALVALGLATALVAPMPSQSTATDAQDETTDLSKATRRIVMALLLTSTVILSMSGVAANLAKPLRMKTIGVDVSSISSLNVVRGLVMLHLPILVGWASDRLGRWSLLSALYWSRSAAVLLLTVAESLWHFLGVEFLMSFAMATGVLRQALVTDLSPANALGTGLALVSVSESIGGIAGYLATGRALDHLGYRITLTAVALLLILGQLLLVPVIRQERKESL